jgi:hypothetical protein
MSIRSISIRSTPTAAAAVPTLGLSSRALAQASKLRKVSLLSIAAIVMFAGIAAWASSSHSPVKVAPPQIDPPLAYGERQEFAQSGDAKFEDVAR